jgi:TonB family protein
MKHCLVWAWIGALVGLFAVGARAQSEEVAGVHGAPEVKTWVRPEYPPELQAAKVQGEVVVRFIVDANGVVNSARIVRSSDPRFEAPVLAAIPQWTFDPGLVNGMKVPMGVEVKWFFKLPYPEAGFLPPMPSTPRPLPRTPAAAESTPDPAYPDELLPLQLNGQVLSEIEVDVNGRVSQIILQSASHPAFARASLDVLHRWTFTPAKQGDLSVADRKRVPMEFTFDSTGVTAQRSPLEANGFFLQVPEGMTHRAICDRAPEILTTIEPVFPLEHLAAAEPIDVEIEFMVNINGAPENLRVTTEGSPAAAGCVLASVEATRFSPAILDGRAVEVRMVKRHRFQAPAGEPDPKDSHELRLLRLLRAGQTVASAKGLDGRLKPLWRVGGVYPGSLRADRLKGRAEVEFVVDSTGRARVPKVINATHPEFGWAAATAIAQWLFEPPTRGGQPTDVRVRVPMEFNPE